ncbi:DUF4097 family beta strand repeat-containing protein [Streptomyces sp. NPDC048518]|uniref:DUF4097 family beta strand repeat-containing protein n=1 Tax=Streptomyces sp. NPDC048518 TaxID=3155029 RepID=UPI0033EFAF54
MTKLQPLAACSLAAATATALLTGCSQGASASAHAPAKPGDKDRKSSSTTYEVRGPASELSVDTTVGDVRVVASDRSGLKVTEKITYSADKPSTSHASRAGKVVLKDHDCRAGSCSVSYRIEVPERLVARIASGGGDITGSALSGNTVARTKGGDVDLAFAEPPADVDTSSGGGDVDLALPAGRYAVRAQTGGGDRKVDVTTDNGSAHRVTAHSDGGDVTVARR